MKATDTNPASANDSREPTLPEIDTVRPASFPRIARILVPIDFTEASEYALSYATAMAAQLGANIIVCHVYQLPMPLSGSQLETMTTPIAANEIDKAARFGVSQAIARHVRDQVPITSVVRPGDPEIEIRSIAREVGADLIVLGTHGRSGFMRFITGSVTDDVVHRAGAPVLVVHGANSKAPPSKS